MEIILNEYKKVVGDPHELKLNDRISFNLNYDNKKSMGVQVNLTAEIYANYE